MTAAELLTAVKNALGVSGVYQDATLQIYIDEVKGYLISAGVSSNTVNSAVAVGVIARGVADLWNYGNGDTSLSEYFYQRAEQLRTPNTAPSPTPDNPVIPFPADGDSGKALIVGDDLTYGLREITEGFATLTGTSESPVYIQDLQSGNYICTGLFKPYEDAGISIWLSEKYVQVYRRSNRVNIYYIDNSSLEIETMTVYTDENSYTRMTIPFDEIALNRPPIDDAMDLFVVTLIDGLNFQNSVAQTQRINITFPDDIVAGYTSKVVFMTGNSLPQMTISGATVVWYVDGAESETLTLSTNTIYHIEFEKDVLGLVGYVRTRSGA